ACLTNRSSMISNPAYPTRMYSGASSFQSKFNCSIRPCRSLPGLLVWWWDGLLVLASADPRYVLHAVSYPVDERPRREPHEDEEGDEQRSGELLAQPHLA